MRAVALARQKSHRDDYDCDNVFEQLSQSLMTAKIRSVIINLMMTIYDDVQEYDSFFSAYSCAHKDYNDNHI